jgi:hypothetical protein
MTTNIQHTVERFPCSSHVLCSTKHQDASFLKHFFSATTTQIQFVCSKSPLFLNWKKKFLNKTKHPPPPPSGRNFFRGAVNRKFPCFWMWGEALFHSLLGLWTSITGVHKKCSLWNSWTSGPSWNVKTQDCSNYWKYNTRNCRVCLCPEWNLSWHATIWANIWNFLNEN